MWTGDGREDVEPQIEANVVLVIPRSSSDSLKERTRDTVGDGLEGTVSEPKRVCRGIFPAKPPEHAIKGLFALFSDDGNTISGQGLQRLQEMLGPAAEPSSEYYICLFLMQTFESSNICLTDVSNYRQITLQQWLGTLTTLRVTTLDALRNAAREKAQQYFYHLSEETPFLLYWGFIFHCVWASTCVTTGPHRRGNSPLERCLPLEEGLRALFRTTHYLTPYAASFCQFRYTCGGTKISLDQWKVFCVFCRKIHPTQLDKYNADDGWPTVFDEYVQWLRSNDIRL